MSLPVRESVQASTATEARPRFQSARTAHFVESVIREMTRLAVESKAVNLAQGFPDFPAPAYLKEAAQKAIAEDINQYSITWGARPFREAIARKYNHWYGVVVEPEREITVCCGSTEGMVATLLAVTNPGDEVIVFEPYYENYWPDTQLCGAARHIVSLRPPDWSFDPEELRRAFNKRTKAIIINTPHNPTGKVFSREELTFISELCQEYDALALTDEIYEHIVYDGTEHVPIMTLPGMRDRTVTINSMSKTYSVTGWRVGWVLAAPDLTNTIRKVHDFLTVGAASPLQAAGISALALPDSYYGELSAEYQHRRDLLLGILDEVGFRSFVPSGAYYIMCDVSSFGFAGDFTFTRHLIDNIGVAAVPGSSFFADPAHGSQLIRFCFCKRDETLNEARTRLRRLRAHAS